MLQLAQRTSAPRLVSVSISTAVWIVMWSEPVTRAPASGCSSAYLRRSDMRPGISCSASSISLRPYSARERSATLKSAAVAVVGVKLPPWGLGCLSGFGECEQALVLLLLPAQPVALADALGALRRGFEPGVDGLAHPRVVAQALGERDVRERAVEPGQQLAQGAQALQLARSEHAVARVGPVRLDQPDALQVAEHSRRPASGLGRLVDRQSVGHSPANLSTIVSRFRRVEIAQDEAAEHAFGRRPALLVEVDRLLVGEVRERRYGALDLALQRRRCTRPGGGLERGEHEVDDRGLRVVDAGWNADYGHVLVARTPRQRAGRADDRARRTALGSGVEAAQRLLVVAAVGDHEDEGVVAGRRVEPLAHGRLGAAAEDLRGELCRAVRDAAPRHAAGQRASRDAGRLDPPQRVA